MNFISVKTEKERKIFLNYCEKNNIKFCSGRKILLNESNFREPGFQVFYNSIFNYISFCSGTTYGQKCNYNEVKFNDFFKINNTLELEWKRILEKDLELTMMDI